MLARMSREGHGLRRAERARNQTTRNARGIRPRGTRAESDHAERARNEVTGRAGVPPVVRATPRIPGYARHVFCVFCRDIPRQGETRRDKARQGKRGRGASERPPQRPRRCSCGCSCRCSCGCSCGAICRRTARPPSCFRPRQLACSPASWRDPDRARAHPAPHHGPVSPGPERSRARKKSHAPAGSRARQKSHPGLKGPGRERRVMRPQGRERGNRVRLLLPELGPGMTMVVGPETASARVEIARTSDAPHQSEFRPGRKQSNPRYRSRS